LRKIVNWQKEEVKRILTFAYEGDIISFQLQDFREKREMEGQKKRTGEDEEESDNEDGDEGPRKRVKIEERKSM
jgi:hypothetical protein